MNELKNIVIWIPLPPDASWKGEGIAQTIENIIKNISKEKRIELVIWRTHIDVLSEEIKNRDNITLKPIGFSKHKSIKFCSESDSISSETIFGLLMAKVPLVRKIINKIKNRLSQLEYITLVYLFSYFQRIGKFSDNKANIWLPTPIIPFSKILKGTKIISFWDPFVFEYKSDYGETAKYLMRKIEAHIKDADVIVTQSDSNREYLQNVMSVKKKDIFVIHNGSPDYSNFIERFNSVDCETIWRVSSFTAKNKSEAENKYIVHQLNFSVLWRLLLKNKYSNRKIILVSTQNRPYKGFSLLLDFFNRLTSENDSYEYIFTCNVPIKLKSKYPILFERIHEITRLSNELHASLYYLSDLVLHPSNVEGGLGSYPQYEAASMNKPSIMNIGRHVFEMEKTGVNTELLSVNFSDFNRTKEKIDLLLNNADEIEKNIQEVNRVRVSWTEVAKNYEKVFFKDYL